MLKEVRCPTCRRLSAWPGNPHRPFCSERCRMQDLGNWASERYRIPDAPAGSPAEAHDDNGGDEAE